MDSHINKTQWLKITAVTLFILALVFAVLGYLSHSNASVGQENEAERPLYQGWKFSQSLPAGQLITRDHLVPFATLQANTQMLSSPEMAIGKRLTRAVTQETLLTQNLLAEVHPIMGELPENYRAIAIRANEVMTVGGYLQPGDRVDIMLLLKPNKESGLHTTARRVASHVLVLAVGEHVTNAEGAHREANAKSVVLSIHESIAPLILLADSAGELRLAAVGSQERMRTENVIASSAEPTLTTLEAASISDSTSSKNTADPLHSHYTVDLKRFQSPSSKPSPTKAVKTARYREPASYIEIIQGSERSMVKTKNEWSKQ
ncbi:Flp pilus assembly protein CpaB [Vibrio cincinnatiensis]|uniref:Flp pilus assembly protein CpaB n=1 Tax=Vibrio cincinnatiensis TaxID=675 RepID=UPI001EDE34C8|nr:Flp pilus assembly protein CpaB [Vibrio cincinnatiensis]MCG3729777.1 Flp pilus assembly protein CpaB [Vibrio cincinnatiensis]